MKVTGHGGDLLHLAELAQCQPQEILDFSVNLRPEGTPEFLKEALLAAFATMHAYPSPYAQEACHAAAHCYNLHPENFVFGNGSNELVHTVANFFAKQGKTHAYILEPAFSEYALACRNAGIKVIPLWGGVTAQEQPAVKEQLLTLPQGALLFMANPANPSGMFYDQKHMLSLMEARPDLIWIIDEAFVEYAGEEKAVSLVPLLPSLPPNILILRSLTKFYALAGVRLGFLVAHAALSEGIRAALPAWTVNCFALQAALAVFTKSSTFAAQTRQENALRRENLKAQLQDIAGIELFPSAANFILFRHPQAPLNLPLTLLKEHRIAVRDCANYYGLEDHTWYRVAVRFPHEHTKLCTALKSIWP